MEVYVEFKPCYKTKYLTKYGFDKIPIIDDSYGRFKNGECNIGYYILYITNDLKYVYCFHDGMPSYYRVTNVSTKPISKKVNKVEEWYKITKEINELKEKRKKLMQ